MAGIWATPVASCRSAHRRRRRRFATSAAKDFVPVTSENRHSAWPGRLHRPSCEAACACSPFANVVTELGDIRTDRPKLLQNQIFHLLVHRQNSFRDRCICSLHSICIMPTSPQFSPRDRQQCRRDEADRRHCHPQLIDSYGGYEAPVGVEPARPPSRQPASDTIVAKNCKPHHPTLPSRLIPISFWVSAMNSMGSCCSTSRTKPLTTSATASSWLRPRCWQ